MSDFPAYPSPPVIDANGQLLRPVDIGCQGLSARDYFAAKAMAALIAATGNNVGAEDYMKASRIAYRHADAMMEERK